MIVTLLADCTLTQLTPGGKASEHAVGQKVWLFKKNSERRTSASRSRPAGTLIGIMEMKGPLVLP